MLLNRLRGTPNPFRCRNQLTAKERGERGRRDRGRERERGERERKRERGREKRRERERERGREREVGVAGRLDSLSLSGN